MQLPFKSAKRRVSASAASPRDDQENALVRDEVDLSTEAVGPSRENAAPGSSRYVPAPAGARVGRRRALVQPLRGRGMCAHGVGRVRANPLRARSDTAPLPRPCSARRSRGRLLWSVPRSRHRARSLATGEPDLLEDN